MSFALDGKDFLLDAAILQRWSLSQAETGSQMSQMRRFGPHPHLPPRGVCPVPANTNSLKAGTATEAWMGLPIPGGLDGLGLTFAAAFLGHHACGLGWAPLAQ